MRWLFAVVLSVLSVLGGTMLTVRSGEAAIGSFIYSFSCSAGKANVNIQWQGVDPGVTDVMIELGDNQSLTPVIDSRTVHGSPSNYVWNGLEVHSTFYMRVSQKLPSGDWNASPVQRFATPCGANPAAADATFLLRGFTDKVGANNTPSDLVVNGGTLNVCKFERLYVFLRIVGLDDVTDFIATWSGPNGPVRTFAFALPSGDGSPFFVTTVPAGAPEGNYGFKLTSGGDVNPVTHVSANLNVSFTC